MENIETAPTTTVMATEEEKEITVVTQETNATSSEIPQTNCQSNNTEEPPPTATQQPDIIQDATPTPPTVAIATEEQSVAVPENSTVSEMQQPDAMVVSTEEQNENVVAAPENNTVSEIQQTDCQSNNTEEPPTTMQQPETTQDAAPIPTALVLEETQQQSVTVPENNTEPAVVSEVLQTDCQSNNAEEHPPTATQQQQQQDATPNTITAVVTKDKVVVNDKQSVLHTTDDMETCLPKNDDNTPCDIDEKQNNNDETNLTTKFMNVVARYKITDETTAVMTKFTIAVERGDTKAAHDIYDAFTAAAQQQQQQQDADVYDNSIHCELESEKEQQLDEDECQTLFDTNNALWMKYITMPRIMAVICFLSIGVSLVQLLINDIKNEEHTFSTTDIAITAMHTMQPAFGYFLHGWWMGTSAFNYVVYRAAMFTDIFIRFITTNSPLEWMIGLCSVGAAIISCFACIKTIQRFFDSMMEFGVGSAILILILVARFFCHSTAATHILGNMHVAARITLSLITPIAIYYSLIYFYEGIKKSIHVVASFVCTILGAIVSVWCGYVCYMAVTGCSEVALT